APVTEAGSYWDAELSTHAVRLLPAEYRVSGEPLALVTLLGSCVAACPYDRAGGVGGMDQFRLPGGHAGSGEGRRARYRVVAQDLDGIQARKVCFFVQTGRTLVKRLPPTRGDDEIVRAERAYLGNLRRAPVAGSVELF